MSQSNIPLWQQIIVIMFSAMIIFLTGWYALHNLGLPDWLTGALGVILGFISHALATSSANAQNATTNSTSPLVRLVATPPQSQQPPTQ